MSSLLTELGLDGLSVEQRLRLMEELWDSLGTDAERVPLTEAQRRELERRLAALDANPAAVVSWEDVEARALSLRPRGGRLTKLPRLRQNPGMSPWVSVGFSPWVPPATSHYHALQIRDFLASVIEGRAPLVMGEDGRAVVAMFTAIYRSVRER